MRRGSLCFRKGEKALKQQIKVEAGCSSRNFRCRSRSREEYVEKQQRLTITKVNVYTVPVPIKQMFIS